MNADELIQKAHGFGMIQNEEEVRLFLDWYAKIQANVIIEIGTHTGGFLSLLLEFGAPGATAISIDLPWQEHEYKVGNFRDAYKDRVNFLVGNSHDEKTRRDVFQILYDTNRKCDFLFLDGDHSYGGVAQDWGLYSPLVRTGGWIGFHDINNGHECGRFYHNVAIIEHPHVEFGFGKTFGIGCVRV